MKLGFSGTRKGMTDWQKRRLRSFLRHFRPVEFHHGDCVGADAEAHKIVRETLPECRIVIHPGNLPRFRAGCKGDLTFDPLDPLHRNRLIVDATEELIAAPEGGEDEAIRSGTWSTIRHARRLSRTIEIIEREQPLSTCTCTTTTKV